jgi:hypothetical protein
MTGGAHFRIFTFTGSGGHYGGKERGVPARTSTVIILAMKLFYTRQLLSLIETGHTIYILSEFLGLYTKVCLKRLAKLINSLSVSRA